MTPRPGVLPVQGEAHEKAVEAAHRACILRVMDGGHTPNTSVMLDAYFASLAARGVRLVAVSEVAEWLDDQCGSARAHWFLARFGGGDDHRHERLGRDCVVCGAGPTGRCDPPGDYEGDCPHGCSPER